MVSVRRHKHCVLHECCFCSWSLGYCFLEWEGLGTPLATKPDDCSLWADPRGPAFLAHWALGASLCRDPLLEVACLELGRQLLWNPTQGLGVLSPWEGGGKVRSGTLKARSTRSLR